MMEYTLHEYKDLQTTIEYLQVIVVDYLSDLPMPLLECWNTNSLDVEPNAW